MIEKEQILLLTQGGLNVFSHFLGFEVNLHRNFRSPFYDDKRASCCLLYTSRCSINADCPFIDILPNHLQGLPLLPST